jgi:hypothetical protein
VRGRTAPPGEALEPPVDASSSTSDQAAEATDAK